jgi:nicotinate-nucleotide adenylyltransferase
MILIFGGAFDPPHLGHQEVILDLLEMPGVKKVFVIPSGVPALKAASRASGDQRQAMLRILLNSELASGRVEILDLEIQRAARTGQPSYTYETILELRQAGRLTTPLAIVIGTDQLRDLPHWHRWIDLLGLATFEVLGRRPDGESGYQAALQGIPLNLRDRFHYLPTRARALSSTQVRESIAIHGIPPENALPAPLVDYLKREHLYGIA